MVGEEEDYADTCRLDHCQIHSNYADNERDIYDFDWCARGPLDVLFIQPPVPLSDTHDAVPPSRNINNNNKLHVLSKRSGDTLLIAR